MMFIREPWLDFPPFDEDNPLSWLEDLICR